jgi:uncharacterized delta-60 repeat protein
MISRLRPALAMSVIAVLLLSLVPVRALAADGDLDSSFGANGKVITDFFGGSDTAKAVVVQSDGKIVAAGFAEGPNDSFRGDFALARYDSNGNLDASFGTNGKVTTDFIGGPDRVNALAVQSDGKIIAAGIAGSTSSVSGTFTDFGLARYDSSGNLDVSFGTNGKVTTDFFHGFDEINAMVLQSDGKIVVAGSASQGINALPHFALARYDSNGNLDASFGTNGKVFTNFSSGTSDVASDVAFALAIQGDGKIIAAGFAFESIEEHFSNFAMARYNSNGSLDASFGINGKVITDFSGGLDVATSIALQTDGKIVLAGFTEMGNQTPSDFALARYDSSGNLDTSFGTNGKVITDFFGQDDRIHAIVLQSGGKIIAAGFASIDPFSGRDSDFALARYDTNGNLDASFSTDGKVTTAFSPGFDRANAVALQTDGKIVAAGSTGGGGDPLDFALARYEGTPSVIEPQPVSQLIKNLKATIASYNLPNGIQTSLTSKLDAALVAFASGNSAAACGNITAFKNEVRALAVKKITAEQAAQLTNGANQIRSAFGCQQKDPSNGF